MHPGGAPSKYDPTYTEMLIGHMASGLSYESFAGVIGISRATLYNWEEAHEEFLDAKKKGSEKNLLYWEQVGQEGLWDITEYADGKPVFKKALNSTVWIFSMKNRHKWKDRQEIDTHVKLDDTREKVQKMSNKDLEELVKSNIQGDK